MILHQYEEGTPCQGMNCGTTTSQHSKECIAEHTAGCAGGFFGKWLPIESAPEDGTLILLLHQGHTAIGWYAPHDCYEWCFVESASTNGPNIEANAFIKSATQKLKWMPLPPPPSLNE
jgi:hypothetical protein